MLLRAFIAGAIICGITVGAPLLSADRRDDVGVVRARPDREVAATYKALSSASLSDRRSLYRALPSATKSELWALQLRNHLAERSDLTADQRDVIREVIARLPEVFAVRNDGLSIELEARVRAAFPAGVASVFFVLGESEPAVAVRHDFQITATDTDPITPTECECSHLSDGCGWHSSCAFMACQKDTDWPACGFLWQYDCDGMCRDNP